MLAPADLYRFTGGGPPDVGVLRARYRSLARGRSEDGCQGWLNWIVRETESGRPIGYVQATLESRGSGAGPGASLAWLITPAAQGAGAAGIAARAAVEWLVRQGFREFRALIHPDNAASQRVAGRLGLTATGDTVDGEVLWRLRCGPHPPRSGRA